jgi:hypothetical protein
MREAEIAGAVLESVTTMALMTSPDERPPRPSDTPDDREKNRDNEAPPTPPTEPEPAPVQEPPDAPGKGRGPYVAAQAH